MKRFARPVTSLWARPHMDRSQNIATREVCRVILSLGVILSVAKDLGKLGRFFAALRMTDGAPRCKCLGTILTSFLPAWVLCAVLIPAVAAASEPKPGDPSADVPLVNEKIRQLMQDRSYLEAVKAIEAAVQAKDAPADYLAYLKAWTLCLAKQYDVAITAYGRLEKEFPQSRWATRARFGTALAQVRKGDFRAAELAYRGEAERLLSPERRNQLARVYLEFADAHFKPPKEGENPDYQKALEFYQKALQIGPCADRRAEVELLAGQCFENLKNYAEAEKSYTQFIQDHPDVPLEIEARFRLGECRLTDNLREARRVFQDLLAKYGDAKSERVAEAAFQLSRTWRIPEPQTDEELSQGVAALESFLKRWAEHKLAGQAHLDIARSYLHRGQQENAVAALNRLLKDERLKDRKETPEGWNLLGHAYQAQKKFPEALAAWREYLGRFPRTRHGAACSRRL